jgi:hypothetical protein
MVPKQRIQPRRPVQKTLVFSHLMHVLDSLQGRAYICGGVRKTAEIPQYRRRCAEDSAKLRAMARTALAIAFACRPRVHISSSKGRSAEALDIPCGGAGQYQFATLPFDAGVLVRRRAGVARSVTVLRRGRDCQVAEVIGVEERRAGQLGGGRIASLVPSLNPPVHISLPQLGKINENDFLFSRLLAHAISRGQAPLRGDRATDAGVGARMGNCDALDAPVLVAKAAIPSLLAWSSIQIRPCCKIDG